MSRMHYGWLSRLWNIYGWGHGVISVGADTLIWGANFTDGTLDTIKGDVPTIQRTNTRYYQTSRLDESIATVTSGNPATVAFAPFIDCTDGGLYFGTNALNNILQSEAPATTWVAVGAPTSVNNSVGTWGAVTYGSIVAAASGDGIQQATGLTAVNKRALASAWMSTTSAALSVSITIDGSTGATPEVSTRTVIVTPIVRRFYFRKLFTAAATGNARLTITVNSAGTLRIGGIQFEARTASDRVHQYPNPYYPTTTTSVSTIQQADVLALPAEILDLEKGTFAFWYHVQTPSDIIDTISGEASTPTFLWQEVVTGGQTPAVRFYYETTTTPSFKVSYKTAASTYTLTVAYDLSPSRWVHIACTWSNVGGTVTCKVFLNGDEIGTGSTAAPIPTVYAGSYPTIGCVTSAGVPSRTFDRNMGFLNLSRVRIHEAALGEAALLGEYNSQKQYYTPNVFHYGYPAHGFWEDFVKFQFTFSESSGNIIDEVAGLTLAPNNTPFYLQTDGLAEYAGLAYAVRPFTTNYFFKAGVDANYTLGTSDAVFECWFRDTGTNSRAAFLDCTNSGTGQGYVFSWTKVSNQMQCVLKASDNTTVTIVLACPTDDYFADEPAKVRWVLDRSASASLYIDGVAYSSASISALSAKTVACNNIYVGVFSDLVTTGTDIELYEMRLSIGTPYNCSPESLP